MSDFAKHLKRVRQAQGVTLYRLAQLTGLSKQGIINLEEPDADPKLSTLVKLAEALGVTVHDLIPEVRPGKRKASGRVNPDGTVLSRGEWARQVRMVPAQLAEVVSEARKERVCISLSALCYSAGLSLRVIESGEAVPGVSPAVLARWARELPPVLKAVVREAKKHRVEVDLPRLASLADQIEGELSARSR